jgi:hypothetical protein
MEMVSLSSPNINAIPFVFADICPFSISPLWLGHPFFASYKPILLLGVEETWM